MISEEETEKKVHQWTQLIELDFTGKNYSPSYHVKFQYIMGRGWALYCQVCCRFFSGMII